MSPAAPHDQDREDMARLAKGTDSALDALMERHAEKLFHYLLRILQNETAANDIAQESFVRVYQNRRKFQLSKKFSTWLYTIATNLARDLQRAQARHPHLPLDAEPESGVGNLREVLSDGAALPADVLESQERAAAVRSAVATLSEDLREILVLSVYEEKSHQEIGEIVGCSAKAVEMRLYRARQLLKPRLEKLHGPVSI